MLNNGNTSKALLAKELNLSMPAVLSNVNGLIDKGIVTEFFAADASKVTPIPDEMSFEEGQ